MDKLNFFTVDLDYVHYLKAAELAHRGFTRVPNMEYGEGKKQKFLCGVVLTVNELDYYVPVTSFKEKKPDNFLIEADNGVVTSSLRFNYMFPVPKTLVSERIISEEPDRAYRALLSQELRYCTKNQDIILRLAERTYKRVLLGKDPGLVKNSCSFVFLEEKCKEYMVYLESFSVRKPSLASQMSAARSKSSEDNRNCSKDISSSKNVSEGR